MINTHLPFLRSPCPFPWCRHRISPARPASLAPWQGESRDYQRGECIIDETDLSVYWFVNRSTRLVNTRDGQPCCLFIWRVPGLCGWVQQTQQFRERTLLLVHSSKSESLIGRSGRISDMLSQLNAANSRVKRRTSAKVVRFSKRGAWLETRQRWSIGDLLANEQDQRLLAVG